MARTKSQMVTTLDRVRGMLLHLRFLAEAESKTITSTLHELDDIEAFINQKEGK